MKHLLFAQLDTHQIHGLPTPNATQGTISTVLSILFGITGTMAVLIIVIAGLRYIAARGDPNGVAQARSTILYAVIGLVVSLAAFSIVTFVLKGIG